MKEVRSRLKRDYKLSNIDPLFQRNLTEAVLSGAKVIEQVMIDNLTEAAAYKLEYDQLREYVLAGKREQLWNVIPPSIHSSQELKDFITRLQRISKDWMIRELSQRRLAELVGDSDVPA
jgi:hypothetical protein